MSQTPLEVTFVADWQDIPLHANDQEESRYWFTHALDARLLNSSLVTLDNTDSTTITLRMDPRMLSKIKRLARLRYLNYQSMIKQWLSERLEEESKK
ncbi:CopG family antitoxin [Kamptonema cortianum]|nr:CopG family antitoxin [Kamptonema cortianum]MDL5044534.1 CopG family antitoxin [Oscillatoria amoena NRMC-F 0135]